MTKLGYKKPQNLFYPWYFKNIPLEVDGAEIEEKKMDFFDPDSQEIIDHHYLQWTPYDDIATFNIEFQFRKFHITKNMKYRFI